MAKCAGYAISTRSDTREAAPLPLATTAQQAELYALTQACILANGKTANIYTESRYAFGAFMIWECCGSKHGFLTSNRNKIKDGLYIQELLDAILLPAALSSIKSPTYSKLDSLEAKRN